MKNIEFDDNYDTLLEVAENGYEPEVSVKNLIDRMISSVPKDTFVPSVVCVSDINSVTKGDQGDLVCETSTGNLYMMDHGCWVKLQ